MPLPGYVGRFWQELDDRVCDVRATWWGAVVTHPEYPSIWDANYARIDTNAEDLTVEEVERTLLPALSAVGASVEHTVHFRPNATRNVLTALSQRGHRLSWDIVMALARPPDGATDASVEPLPAGDELWGRVDDAMRMVGVEPGPVAAQVGSLERALTTAGTKRWFGIRDGSGTIVSLAALLLLAGVGYVDNVATFPDARGRGYASAVTTAIVREARDAGADAVILLADPDAGSVVRMYERLGFEDIGRLAATRGEVPRSQEGGGT